MKTLVSFVSLLLLPLLTTSVSTRADNKALPSAQTGSGVEQALLDLERKWAAAGLKSDATVLADILADDWTSVSAEGAVKTRAQAIDDMKKIKLTRSEVSEMKVRTIKPDTAVVTGVWSGAGTDEKGQKFDTSERWTDVFVNQGGKWKCVASHNSTIKK